MGTDHQCCHKRYTLNPAPTLWGQGIPLDLLGEVFRGKEGPHLNFHNRMEHVARGQDDTWPLFLVSSPGQVRKPSSQGFCPEDSSRQISRINPGPW